MGVVTLEVDSAQVLVVASVDVINNTDELSAPFALKKLLSERVESRRKEKKSIKINKI